MCEPPELTAAEVTIERYLMGVQIGRDIDEMQCTHGKRCAARMLFALNGFNVRGMQAGKRGARVHNGSTRHPRRVIAGGRKRLAV